MTVGGNVGDSVFNVGFEDNDHEEIRKFLLTKMFPLNNTNYLVKKFIDKSNLTDGKIHLTQYSVEAVPVNLT